MRTVCRGKTARRTVFIAHVGPLPHSVALGRGAEDDAPYGGKGNPYLSGVLAE